MHGLEGWEADELLVFLYSSLHALSVSIFCSPFGVPGTDTPANIYQDLRFCMLSAFCVFRHQTGTASRSTFSNTFEQNTLHYVTGALNHIST